MNETSEERRRFWDEKHSAGVIEGDRLNPFFVEEAAKLPPGRALELGCGDGTAALWLATKGWSVTAVDISPVALSRARLKAIGEGLQVGWQLADLREYAPVAGRYDLVVALFLQLRETERRLVYRRAAEALRPGGTLLVVAHDLSNLTEGVGGPPDASLLFTPDDLRADLPGLRFNRAEVVRRGESVPGPLDAIIVATRPDGPVGPRQSR